MSTITELQGKLDDLRQKAAKAFEEAGPDLDMTKITSIEGDTSEKAAQLKAWNDEMSDVAGQLKEKQSLDGFRTAVVTLGEVEPHPGFPKNGKSEPAGEQKSIGELFTEANPRKGVEVELKDVDVKAVFSTAGGSIAYTGATTGWYPMDFRSGRLVDYYATRQPLRVTDMVSKSTTNAAAITYIQEGTVTNAATTVTEGSAKPEASLDLDTVTEAVRKIAVWIPVTEEQLADVAQVRDYLNNRLGWMVRQRLDAQIIAGDGTAPNLSGILDRNIQTQAKGSDPTPDAVYKAMTKIEVNDFSEANGVVFHPNDWQEIRLLRTADGIYIWGSPSEAGPERIWGLDVAKTVGLTEGTALVGDFRQAELAMRQGLTLRITDSHDDYFTKNVLVVLAELRAALLVYRPNAFCSVTGV